VFFSVKYVFLLLEMILIFLLRETCFQDNRQNNFGQNNFSYSQNKSFCQVSLVAYAVHLTTPIMCCAEGSVDSAGLKPKVVTPDLIRHPEGFEFTGFRIASPNREFVRNDVVFELRHGLKNQNPVNLKRSGCRIKSGMTTLGVNTALSALPSAQHNGDS
jgi:hypothetical protein